MKSITRLPRTALWMIALITSSIAGSPAHAFFVVHQTLVIEFLNDVTKRRVLLVEQFEIDAVEKGLAGPGWRRSGLTFRVRPDVAPTAEVCRFYAPSVNSHFFTPTTAECEDLKNPASGWIYERTAFRATVPDGESCPILSPWPVYRLYNNRAAFGDSTHRYTPDAAVRQALIDQGWIYERIAFCATGWSYTNPSYQIDTSKVLKSELCENESLNLGPCIGLNQTADLPILVHRHEQVLPHPFVFPRTPIPVLLTGVEGDIRTSVNSTYAPDIAEHSFVQIPPGYGNFPGLGIYVNSRDRMASALMPVPTAMSINPLYQFITTPPKENEADKRVMPWRDGNIRTLELSFNLQINHVRRGDSESHAISHPTLELIDTRSRRNLYITLAGGQTVPIPNNEKEDYFAADVGTGKIIVSTSFRANPAFGERIRGESFFCSATADNHQCNQTGDGSFAFRLRPADIAYVIAKARKLDSTLSPDMADYAIDNFSFNNETFNNAELGLRLHSYRLDIFEQQY